MRRNVLKAISGAMALAVVCSACGTGNATSSDAGASAETIADNAAEGGSAGNESAGTTATGESTEGSAEDSGASLINLDVTKQYTSQTDSESRVLVRGTYFTISADDSVKAAYPKLATSLTAFSDAHKSTIEKETESLKSEAAAYSSNYDEIEDVERPFTYVDSKIERADSSVVCILDKISSYSGGAHDDYYYNSYMYDPETGAELTLSDILNDTSGIAGMISERIQSSYSSDIFIVDDISSAIESMIDKNDSMESDSSVTGDILDTSGMAVVLGYDNIKFIFSPYSLSYFAAGTQSVTFYFDEYPDLVKPEYMQSATNYFTPLEKGELYRVSDMTASTPADSAIAGTAETGNELADSVTTGASNQVASGTSGGDLADMDIPDGYFGYFYSENQDSEIEKTDLYLGDSKVVYDEYVTAVQPYLVKNNGKTYIYVATRGMDDYSGIHVYGVENGELKDIGGMDQGFMSDSPIDPASFALEQYTDILGTYGTYNMYHIGDDGMPVTDDEYLFIQNDDKDRKLTSLKALTVQVEDANDSGNWTEQELPAGTVMYPYRTDGESFMDMKLEDGKICRVGDIAKTDSGTNSNVGGVSESDVFDGIMYAG